MPAASHPSAARSRRYFRSVTSTRPRSSYESSDQQASTPGGLGPSGAATSPAAQRSHGTGPAAPHPGQRAGRRASSNTTPTVEAGCDGRASGRRRQRDTRANSLRRIRQRSVTVGARPDHIPPMWTVAGGPRLRTVPAMQLLRPVVEPRVRVPRLVAGLVLCGLGIAFMVAADLGLAPWSVLDQAISDRTGIPIGTVSIFVGAVVLLAWLPLRERPGLGTILNVLLIGL